MKHGRVTAASLAAVLNPLAVLGPLAGIAASVAGVPPARGVDVPFTERVISTAAHGAYSVFATDLDGDGDTDVLSASVYDDKIAWYENNGSSPPTFTERMISTTADGAISVFATDMDGDGDTDVLSASNGDDKIAWYESNGGSPPTFTERVISTAADGVYSVFATDMDGDGDTDVLSASAGDNKIAWYENNGGSPPTFTERVILTTANGLVSVFATDVDGDGHTDVLSASVYDDKITWYESDGSSPPTFTERVISTTADGGLSVFATDVDGDGDTDVLSASQVEAKIAWYESNGASPPTFTEWVISTAANGATSVFATDVDGDGDTDVLSASQGDDKIAWYESNGGSPPTFTERVISTNADGARSVFATDLDGDGDTDVLSASMNDAKIAWYENTTPTECPIADPPTQPAGEADYEKVRYISFVPGNPGRQTALRVTLKTLPPPFGGLNDTQCWVGEPQQVSENAGKIAHEPGWPDFMSANLQGSPHCMDWSTVEVLHVTDDEIIPSAVYDVQAIECQCDFENEAHYSAPLTITTSKWGDSVGTCAVIPCTPPEGVVNMASDVTACFDKFRNLAGAVLKSRADIEPNLPDSLVNISDCTFELDAFRGFAYPAAQTPPAPGWPGPDGCP